MPANLDSGATRSKGAMLETALGGPLPLLKRSVPPYGTETKPAALQLRNLAKSFIYRTSQPAISCQFATQFKGAILTLASAMALGGSLRFGPTPRTATMTRRPSNSSALLPPSALQPARQEDAHCDGQPKPDFENDVPHSCRLSKKARPQDL